MYKKQKLKLKEIQYIRHVIKKIKRIHVHPYYFFMIF